MPTHPQSQYRPGIGANRDVFDVPDDIAYFNTATLSLQLHGVRSAGEGALRQRARPWTISASDWFTDVETARSLVADLVRATAEHIAVIPATSYGFAVAARSLRLNAGERILVLAEEYPSGVYTWRRAARVSGAEILTVCRLDGQSWTEAILAELDDRVAIVSVPNVHWTDGALVDLAAVAARTHELGASLVIDSSQSLGALPLDVSQLRPDFVVTVGYKWLLGPFGLGYLYVDEAHHDKSPLEENWILRADSEDFARLVDYRDEYQPGARRFDVGQRTNFELMPMAVAALQQLQTWQISNVASGLQEVTDRVAAGVAEIGLETLPPDQRGPHLLGVLLDEAVRDDVLQALDDAHCYAAVRGGALRIAPHLHTTERDIEALLGALTRAIRR